jgi:hypothetical protein
MSVEANGTPPPSRVAPWSCAERAATGRWHNAGVGAEPPLPLYVEERPSRHAVAGEEHASMVATLRTVGRSAVATADRLIADGGHTGAVAPAPAIEVRHLHGYTVTRHVLARPELVVRAFEQWLERTGAHVVTASGHLDPADRAAIAGPRVLRVVPATLHLRGSLVSVPVDLELVPWGAFRAALHLDPARRLVKTMGWHRRASYFAAGHAVLEHVRGWIERSVNS